MLRGIDTQVMLQQTVNAARVAGEKAHESDQAKEFQAQLEQERAVEEMDTVQNTQAAEHRRVEEDQDGQAEADWRFEQQHREKRERQAEEELDEFEREIKEIELRAEQRMKQVGVGGGLDITV